MVPRIPRGLSWWRADQDTVCGNVLQDIPRGKCREVQWKCLQNLRYWQKWYNWLQRVHAGAPCHLSWNTRGETSLGIQDVRCRWQWGNWFPWNETVSLHDFDIHFWKHYGDFWFFHTIILWQIIFGFILSIPFLHINQFVILYSFDHSSPQKCWINIQHTQSKWWKI